MLKLVIQVLTKFLLYKKAGGIKPFKLFLFSPISITLIIVLAVILFTFSSTSALALQGDYNKNSTDNNTLTTSEWNLLDDDFVNTSGDTMTGNLNIFRSSGDNAELQLESVSGAHWGLYHDRTSNDLRFWNNEDRFTFTDNGNFGIGTTNPNRLLSIFSSSGGKGMELKSPNPSLWFIDNTSANKAWSIYNQGSDDGLAFRSENDDGSGRNTRFFLEHSTGNVGIGTSSPSAGLDVNAGSTYSIQAGSKRIGSVATPVLSTDAVTKDYVDTNFAPLTGAGYWELGGNTLASKEFFGSTTDYGIGFKTNDLERMTITNSGNIGIGTDNPGSLLTIANDNWLSSVNSDGTGYVNMFKVNSNNQLELGTAINAGTFEFAPDSGFNTFVDMAVTSAPAVGTVEGYSLKLDGNNILAIYSEADGSGGIQNEGVGIGTAMPSSKLTLADGDFEMTNNKSIKIQDANNNTTLLIGNYADGGGFSYGSDYTASLAVEGDVKGHRICIEEDCKSTWSGIVSGGMPSGTNGQTLRYSDTDGDWIANSLLYNDGTDIGIGTASPTTDLDVYGNTAASMFYDRDNTNYYIDPAANVMSHSAIFAGNVGIGTTGPNYKLDVVGGDIYTDGSYRIDDDGTKRIALRRIDGVTRLETGTGVANKHIALVTESEERLFVQDDGNVGIDTTAPSVKLDIDGGTGQVVDVSSGRIQGLNLIPVADSEAVPRKYLHDNFAPITGGDGSAFVQGGNSFGTTAVLGTNDNYNLNFETDGTTRMTLDTGGDLSVDSDISASIFYDINNSNYYVNPDGTSMPYSAIFAENVGIGTTAPAVKLAVAGEMMMGSTGTSCDATKEGAYRYNDDSEQTQMCNGEKWINVTSCGVAVDEDGNKYGTVKIGGQCWMAENINVGTMLASGSDEPNTSDAVIEKWCHGNDPSNCEEYGGLYNWNEAMRGSEVAGSQGICMDGWHIPTDNELNILESYVVNYLNSTNPQYPCSMSETGWQRCADDNGANFGGTYGAGKSLKAVGEGNGTDDVGFSGKLAGYRNTNGSYFNLGSNLYLWSSTPSSSTGAFRRLLITSYSSVYRNSVYRGYGFSVRCLKD